MAGLACAPRTGGDPQTPVTPTTAQALGDVPAWVAGGDAFALTLHQQLRGTTGNLFFAPGNLRTALAMTYAGAAGTTAQEMATALRFEALPDRRLHSAQAAAVADLQAGARDVTLRVANRLWGPKSEPFVPEFLERTREDYGAELVGVDFAASELARQTINAWVSQQTEAKIPELLAADSLGPDTRLVLTSAIYFKGGWLRPFDPARTLDQPFAVPGLAVPPAVPTMQQSGRFRYAEIEGAQLLELPYVGGRLAMTIVLPRAADGLPALEAGLDPATFFKDWLGALTERHVRISLPRFTTRARFELASVLAVMGMPTAFTGAADFSKMSRAPLQISRVIHEAFIDVTEAGTEAAAATAVVMSRSGSLQQPPSFTADRPFLYLIRDVETGQILFLGRVVDPRG